MSLPPHTCLCAPRLPRCHSTQSALCTHHPPHAYTRPPCTPALHAHTRFASTHPLSSTHPPSTHTHAHTHTHTLISLASPAGVSSFAIRSSRVPSRGRVGQVLPCPPVSSGLQVANANPNAHPQPSPSPSPQVLRVFRLARVFKLLRMGNAQTLQLIYVTTTAALVESFPLLVSLLMVMMICMVVFSGARAHACCAPPYLLATPLTFSRRLSPSHDASHLLTTPLNLLTTPLNLFTTPPLTFCSHDPSDALSRSCGLSI